MKRREFIGCVAGAASAAIAQATEHRPNILYIHSHDTGRYIQPFGHAIPTPNLQRLASQGVLFRQAYSAAPTCSPSRASLLTGMCPHSNGMLGLAHRGFSMNNYEQHMLHTLRRAGYLSTLAGLQHIAAKPETIGFDKLLLPKSTRVEQVTAVTTEFLKKAPRPPFFLDVGFFETHREYRAPGPQDDARYARPPAPIPDTPETRRDIAGFMASARALDTGVGEILSALEASGLVGNTLVISTTDHGVAFPAMKCNMTGHGTGVSLIMRGPGGFDGGKVCDALVSHLDMFPTLCDLLDIERPAWLQGKSMMPLIRGEAKEVNEQVFVEVNYHAAYEPMRAVRTRRWNYVRRFDDRGHPNLPNCDDGFSKSLWLEHGWGERTVAREELYDLVFDPNETRNVANDPSLAATLKDMRGRLDSWMRATDDPLLRGPVPAPPGAVVNDPNGTSPKEPVQKTG